MPFDHQIRGLRWKALDVIHVRIKASDSSSRRFPALFDVVALPC